MSLAGVAIVTTATALAALAGYWYALGWQSRADDLLDLDDE